MADLSAEDLSAAAVEGYDHMLFQPVWIRHEIEALEVDFVIEEIPAPDFHRKVALLNRMLAATKA